MRQRKSRWAEWCARLEAADRRTRLDFAEFLARRRAAVPAEVAPLPRPADEGVVSAIRHLHRSHPRRHRHCLLHTVEKAVSQNMIEDRPALEVIDELEALFAAGCRSSAGV